MKIKAYIWEIKARFGYIIMSFICTFFIAYQKALQLTHIFVLSFGASQGLEKKFIFTDIYEAFSSTVTICLISSLLLILPFIAYQTICFLLPTWYIYERHSRCKSIVGIFILLVFYLYIMHIIVIPELCSFLLNFQVLTTCLTITVEAKILSYVSWAVSLLFLASLVFILAWIIAACVVYKVISIHQWGKYHKMYIWCSLLFAAILSPPELWSQFLLACFFYLFSEVLLWICFVYDRFSFYRIKSSCIKKI